MRHAILKSVPLFEGLSDDEVALLAERCSDRRASAGERIFREGDPVDGLYVVETGAVSIVRDAVGQPVQRLARLGPGGFFGEMGLLDGGTRSASAVASEPTTLVHVRKSDLIALLRQRPLLAVKLRTAIIRRHGHNVASAVELSGRREVRTRIDADVELELPDGSVVRAQVENLSLGGACFRGLPADWTPGRTVRFSLRLPHLPGGEAPLAIEGSVAWRTPRNAGIAFHHRDRQSGEESVRRAIRQLLGR